MKTSIALILLLVTQMGFMQKKDNRIDIFLKKIEKFYEQSSSDSTTWSMPNYHSDTLEHNMPIRSSNFFDHETGLEYSPHKKKIYDNKLQFVLDMSTGMVNDLETGETYSLKELLFRKKT